jgi:hypothetical protein
MKQIVKTAFGAVAALAVTAAQASAAQICIPIINLCLGEPNPGTPGGNTPPAAPEIDVTQGFAALAILIVAALLLRERFLRQREQA